MESSQVWSTKDVSVEGFQDFIVQFSDMIGKEMAGFYYTDNGSNDISYIHMGRGKNNTYRKSTTEPQIYNVRPDLLGLVSVHTNWHTHPSFADNKTTISEKDKEFKKSHLEKGVKHFIILTGNHPPIYF